MTDTSALDDSLPDFSGKVVVFHLGGSPPGVENGVIMEYAEFRRLGGTLFVVGRGPAWRGTEWNIPSGVAWSAVVNYLVFPSRAEFEGRMVPRSKGLLAKFFPG
jgi:hypothetical protein